MNAHVISFLSDLFTELTGIPLRNEHDDFTALCYPYATARVARVGVLGIDNSLYSEQSAGQDFDHTAVGRREFTWSVKVIGECSDVDSVSKLDTFRLLLETDPYVDMLRAENLGFSDAGALTIIPPHPHSSLQTASVDMTFTAAREVELGSEYAIDAVDLASAIKKADGTDAPAQFSGELPS